LTFAQIDYAAMGLQGTLVQTVAPGSAAEKAGILADDLIVKVDEQTVVSGEKLDRYLRQQKDRSAFNLVILRNNLPRQLILRLP
jgi:S1-C subfamily serine protease